MKFELIDLPEPTPSSSDEPTEHEPGLPPVRVVAERARGRVRAESEALRVTLDRMWETIASTRTERSPATTTPSVVPTGFRPEAFSRRDT
ncbi:hypothetical protein ACIQFP_17000 [Nocardiopsis alba]|uniref:hypothetical protein n=1 Tax=Nocardiopsis alba TaxID=53437 RepID=UPI003813AA83